MLQSSRSAKTVTSAWLRGDHNCCTCWHIKHGTMALGIIELLAVIFLLFGTVSQVVKKTQKVECTGQIPYLYKLFRNCVFWDFSTLNWTLVGDYVISFLLFTIAVSILLLFLGIMKKAPNLLVPHLLVQATCLVSSLAYFFLYAWSYFYVDLYINKENFNILAVLERMWLAVLLLILAGFELYIFFIVLKCCLYLQSYQYERLRRIKQYEECTRRVRDAKKNGLWRSTSWGGGFQEYRGQYSTENSVRSKKRNKPNAHVQWNLQGNMERSASLSDDDILKLTSKKQKSDKCKQHKLRGTRAVDGLNHKFKFKTDPVNNKKFSNPSPVTSIKVNETITAPDTDMANQNSFAIQQNVKTGGGRTEYVRDNNGKQQLLIISGHKPVTTRPVHKISIYSPTAQRKTTAQVLSTIHIPC